MSMMAAAAVLGCSPTAVDFEGPCVKDLTMKLSSSVCVPAGIVNTFLPEVAALPPGSNRPIAVQLVQVPPHASDASPDTRPEAVTELRHGITIRKSQSMCRGSLREAFHLTGLILKRSHPVVNGWFLRGVRYLGPDYVQLLCSPELPPEVAAAKQSLVLQQRLSQQQNQQGTRQQHIHRQQTGQQNAEPHSGGMVRSGSGFGDDDIDSDDYQTGSEQELDNQGMSGQECNENASQQQQSTRGQPSTAAQAAPAASSRRAPLSGPKAAAAARAARAAAAAAAPVEASTDGPYFPSKQQVRKSVSLPVGLVSVHMPELDSMPYGINQAIAVQLVHLPAYAEDITAETPAQRVEDFKHGMTVRKKQGAPRRTGTASDVYSVSGLPLSRSDPACSGWYLRGVRKLGERSIQLLCSPELPPELAEAVQSVNASKREKLEQRKKLQQEEERQFWRQRMMQQASSASAAAAAAPARKVGRPSAAEKAAAVKAAAAVQPVAESLASAVADAGSPRSPARALHATAGGSSSGVAVSTDGPMVKVLNNMQAIIYIPLSLVSTHIEELSSMPPLSSKPVQVQLVLLPPHAADVSPETPAQRVIELKYGVTVRKGRMNESSGTCTYTVSGLTLKQSKPAKEGWFIRGVRHLGGVRLQLLCSPELPPELAEAKRSQDAARQAKRRETEQLKRELERQKWAQKAQPDAQGTAVAAVATALRTAAVPARSVGGSASQQAQQPQPAASPSTASRQKLQQQAQEQQQLFSQPRQQQFQQQQVEQQQLSAVRKRLVHNSKEGGSPAGKRSRTSDEAAAAVAAAADGAVPCSPFAFAAAAAPDADATSVQQLRQGSLQSHLQRGLSSESDPTLQRHESFKQQGSLQQQLQRLESCLSGTKHVAPDGAAEDTPASKRSRLSCMSAAVVGTDGIPARAAAAASARLAAADDGDSLDHEDTCSIPDHEFHSDAFAEMGDAGEWQQQSELAQQQPKQQGVQQGMQEDLTNQLPAALAAVDRQQLHTAQATCKWWSGQPGSCRRGSNCRYSGSHQLDCPTAYYKARAAVLERFGVACNAQGTYPGVNRDIKLQQQTDCGLVHDCDEHAHAVGNQPRERESVQSLSLDERRNLLEQELRDADRRWHRKAPDCCKFWSGRPGSCRSGLRCSRAASHVVGPPSLWYVERAAVYLRFGVQCDAVRRHNEDGLLDTLPQQSAQQGGSLQQGQLPGPQSEITAQCRPTGVANHTVKSPAGEEVAAPAEQLKSEALSAPVKATSRGVEFDLAVWNHCLPDVQLQPDQTKQIGVQFVQHDQRQQTVTVKALARCGHDRVVRLAGEALRPLLQQLAGSCVTHMSAAASSCGSYIVTLTVSPAAVVSLQQKQDDAGIAAVQAAAANMEPVSQDITSIAPKQQAVNRQKQQTQDGIQTIGTEMDAPATAPATAAQDARCPLNAVTGTSSTGWKQEHVKNVCTDMTVPTGDVLAADHAQSDTQLVVSGDHADVETAAGALHNPLMAAAAAAASVLQASGHITSSVAAAAAASIDEPLTTSMQQQQSLHSAFTAAAAPVVTARGCQQLDQQYIKEEDVQQPTVQEQQQQSTVLQHQVQHTWLPQQVVGQFTAVKAEHVVDQHGGQQVKREALLGAAAAPSSGYNANDDDQRRQQQNINNITSSAEAQPAAALLVTAATTKAAPPPAAVSEPVGSLIKPEGVGQQAADNRQHHATAVGHAATCSTGKTAPLESASAADALAGPEAADAAVPDSTSSMPAPSTQLATTAAVSPSEMLVADFLAQLNLPRSVKDQLAEIFDREVVLTVDVLAEMTADDFREIKVPKGPAMMITKKCKELMRLYGCAAAAQE